MCLQDAVSIIGVYTYCMTRGLKVPLRRDDRRAYIRVGKTRTRVDSLEFILPIVGIGKEDSTTNHSLFQLG